MTKGSNGMNGWWHKRGRLNGDRLKGDRGKGNIKMRLVKRDARRKETERKEETEPGTQTHKERRRRIKRH